jgi:acyl carrier protein
MSIKHLDLIKKSFELKKKDVDKITKDENIELENYNWDSLTVINLITLVSDKYKKNIKPDKLKKLKTFKNLDNFLNKLISKKSG